MSQNLRKSIGLKVLVTVLAVSLTGLLVSIFLGMGNMVSIRNVSLESSHALGTDVAEKSEEALVGQMKRNIQLLAENKSSAGTNVTLGQYLGLIRNFSSYLTRINQEPEHFLPQQVQTPQKKNGGVNTLQLTMEHGVSQESVQQKADLLGNIRYEFAPVMENNEGIITTMYVASEEGFMLSYDKNSDQADSAYFDFKDSEWYRAVKEQPGPMFVDVYKDAMNRGLMTTCAAPFYDQQGGFAGIVCMDMRLEDIYQELIQVEVSKNTKGYLMDREGRMIAGPGVDYSAEKFSDITVIDSSEEFKKILPQLSKGQSGVEEVNDYFYAFAPVNFVNWTLVIQVPRADIIQPVDEMRQGIVAETEQTKSMISGRISMAMAGFFGVLTVSAACMILVAWRFTNKLVQPIRNLQKQVRIISEGDLDARVTVESEDEIGDLAKEFNDMAESLKKQMEEIRQVTAEKERIGAELSVATQIQASMLPGIFPAFPDKSEFDIFASMDPAKEVGGDFYDFFLVDDTHLAIVMADVSGKGVPAALFMVIAKTLIKDAAQMGLSPDQVFEKTNEKLCESNDEGLFVTAWMGILDITTGRVSYVNAGHNPPLVYRKNGAFDYLKQKPGFVLAGMEGMRYRCGELELGIGDMLYLYTDGVTEAVNVENELYGEERLKRVLDEEAVREDGKLDPECILKQVREDIRQFTGAAEQSDDITMLGVKLYKTGEEQL